MLVAVLCVVAAESMVAQDQYTVVRIRSHSARIKGAIAEGTARSATFRRLVEMIDAGDVLVYVDEGECRHSVAACLLLSVTIAGLVPSSADPRESSQGAWMHARRVDRSRISSRRGSAERTPRQDRFPALSLF